MMALAEAPLDLSAGAGPGWNASSGSVGSRFRGGKNDEEEDDDYEFVQSPASFGSPAYGGGRRTSNQRQPNNELPYVVHEEPFGRIPTTMVQKTMEIYPSMQHYGQVDFVAVGMGASWIIGVMGKLCFWDKIEGKIVKNLAKVYEEGESLRNVTIAPTTNSIYVIEAKDGTVQYRVPDEWHAKIKGHLHPSNALELEGPRIHRPMPKPWQHQSQPLPQPQPQPPSLPRSRSATAPRGRGRGGGLHSGGSVGGSRPNSLFVPPGGGPPGRKPSPSPPPPQSGPGYGRGAGGSRPNSSFHPQQYRPPPGPPPPGSYDPNAPPAYVPYQPPPNYLSADPNQVYAQNAPTSGVIQAPGSYRRPQHHHSQPTSSSRNDEDDDEGKQPVSLRREAMVAMIRSTPAILGAGVQLIGLAGLACTIM
ncbi:hypothetical protein M407DRAFT_103553 [Tulasnella calospora MUT 4182]|uniref:Uncharacterized protein n=1 Tax=Tulasnella calospora MUT 4182 TaxID=1051891 RepID=A0A0C3QEA1_9AGAM|nr:hypothetical protein M407DRAFT_103553 [Tulasnella calospora MUT 4182]